MVAKMVIALADWIIDWRRLTEAIYTLGLSLRIMLFMILLSSLMGQQLREALGHELYSVRLASLEH